MRNGIKRAFVSVLFISSLVAAPMASADALDDIMQSGKIRVAMDLGIPPFAYKDENLKTTGSEYDTAALLAKELGVELEIIPVTGANRIPFLLTNKADIVISALGITDERKKVIQFSIPYSGAQQVIAGPADIEINGYPDLAGKSIAVTRGGMEDTNLSKSAPPEANLVRFEDEATTQTAVTSGQVPIIAQTTAVVSTLNKRVPTLKLEPKFTLSIAYYAVGMRRGEDRLKTEIDEIIRINLANGKLAQIFNEYHGADLPDGINEGRDR